MLEKDEDFIDKLDSTFQQEYDDDIELQEEPDLSELPEENEERNPRSDDTGMFRPISMVAEEQMISDVRSLSHEQKIVFEKYLSYCKSRVFSQSKFDINVTPPRLIVHGNDLFLMIFI